MRRSLLNAVLALSTAMALPAAAEPLAYAISFNKLYRIDLASGQTSLIGETGFNDVEGLAMAADGVLYGLVDSTKTLITIDKASGHGTMVGGGTGNTGLSGQGVGQFDALDFGLAFTCDGRLFASSDTVKKLWQIDRASGHATLVGDLGFQITGLGADGGGLYGLGSQGDEGVYRINSTTAASTRLGVLAPNLVFADGGLDFDAEGRLWAILDYRPPDDNRPSDIVRVDLNSGAATFVSTTLPEMEGLAIGPTPVCRGPLPGGNAASIPVGGSVASVLLAIVLACSGWLAIVGWRRAS
ncbi:MAG: hypothetical protein IPG63_06540 [Xanthomonadales bacterium]|jgi:hypothetical protein|nr:hypothetical protein [Xanthomonadales bacterium]MBK7143729.1 hypothetical protein [Xanthomonadales bacterium]MCC6560758.1 hypothetical protein [Xanthomonadales bacterium]